MISRLLAGSIFILMLLRAAGPTFAAEAASSDALSPDARPFFRAPADSTADTVKRNGNRWRFQVGGAAVVQKGEKMQPFPTVNIDYRWSRIPTDREGFSMSPIGEIGITILLPYLKGGLEMRYGGLFIDGHAGGTVAIIPGGHSVGFGPVFFAGACGGYMFSIGGIDLELETGFNAPGIGVGLMFPYATAAITW